MSGLLFIFGLYEFGNSLQVASINTTVIFHLTQLELSAWGLIDKDWW